MLFPPRALREVPNSQAAAQLYTCSYAQDCGAFFFAASMAWKILARSFLISFSDRGQAYRRPSCFSVRYRWMVLGLLRRQRLLAKRGPSEATEEGRRLPAEATEEGLRPRLALAEAGSRRCPRRNRGLLLRRSPEHRPSSCGLYAKASTPKPLQPHYARILSRMPRSCWPCSTACGGAAGKNFRG